ncbi:hypothetical protein SAMN05421770_102422 [Granulicella rosea]|uniref:Uncharacterized protein n=1 Tax=Granulicella rosea TaxID=474952 RepID=A0A239HJI7_9BACT|nr:hypothetical protein SAMN05421770_102422 [Granulicella rosea]
MLLRETRMETPASTGTVGWHAFRTLLIQKPMNVYGYAMSSSKREANGKVVEMALKPFRAST